MGYDYWNMNFNPFDKNCQRQLKLFETKDTREMQARLMYLFMVYGLGVFTALPGLGKTYCLRNFVASRDPNLYTMVYLALTTVGVRDFYREICMALDLDFRGTKPKLFRDIQARILELYRQNRPLVLMIDEAQHLNANILNDLKILLNLEYDSENCFVLILMGEPSLNRTLSNPSFEALHQRVVVHYNFTGLKDEEVTKYVSYKLDLAGGSDSIMTKKALDALKNVSRGNPRIIDKLMTYALELGEQMKEQHITDEMIESADHAVRLR